MTLQKPRSLIGKAASNIQITKFQNEKWHLLSGSIQKHETRNLFFSKDQIKEWWDEILYQETVDNKRVTGLRIYLGTYPNDHHRYAKQINLIVVLTKFGANGNNEDFFIEEQPGFSDRPNPPEITGGDLDHGIPCPPDCDGGEHWPE